MAPPSPVDGSPLIGIEDRLGMIVIDEGPNIGLSMIDPSFTTQTPPPATTVNTNFTGDDSSTPPAPYETKIPVRVKCQVPISIQAKDGGKRGLHILEDVKEGDLIFKISNPLLCIVNYSEDAGKTTCDNCLARHVFATKESKLTTNPNISHPFPKCNECNVVYYCNETCQKAAWEHHHKYECKTYDTIKRINFSFPDGNSFISSTGFRGMARLLQLYKNDKISEDEWSEFVALSAVPASEMRRDEFVKEAEGVVILFQQLIELPLSRDVVTNLLCALLQNQRTIKVPILNGACRAYDPVCDSTFVESGGYIDPFTSLINHDCNANTWVIFERNELRVRALRDIPAGTELTNDYNVPTLSDDDLHKKTLAKKWNIECNCAIDEKGPVGLTGELKSTVTKFKLSPLNKNKSLQEQQEVEQAIEDMIKAGFGYGTKPMEILQKHAMWDQIDNFNFTQALQTCLKIYYLILPAMSPKPVLHHRIPAFVLLVYLLDIDVIDLVTPPQVASVMKRLPQKVSDLLPDILVHLRAKLLSDTTKCFGEDSMTARFEKEIFEDRLAMSGPSVPALGNYVPLGESRVERDRFLKGMNELMKWAGLPTQNLEQLLF